MLRLATPAEADLVYDLGCGDGAISLEVARTCGARCVGFDIDEVHLASARTAAEAHDLSALLEYRNDDVLELDFSPATVLVIFLVPNMLAVLAPKFRQMKAGTRIVSYHFPLPDWPPVSTEETDHPHTAPPATTSVYYYVVEGPSSDGEPSE